jgi:hypothetical protein
MSVDITNDADDGESDSEQLIIDGETTTIALSIRRRVHERLELGIAVPYVQHSGGTLDGFIKDWHSMLGLSNFRLVSTCPMSSTQAAFSMASSRTGTACWACPISGVTVRMTSYGTPT